MRVQMSRSRPVTGIAMVLTTTWAIGLPAEAIEFRGGEEAVVAADEIVEDDLYISGDAVTVLGTVAGDLVAAGRLITLDGTVKGDMIAAGQAVVVNGEVWDDVRMAGMALRVGPGATVADDLIAAGFSFESDVGSRIGGSAVLTGFQALVSGQVDQDLRASLIGLRLAGEVGGDLEASVESDAGPAWWTGFIDSPVPMPSVAAGLTLDDQARVEGDLSYSSKDPAKIAPASAVVGEILHRVPQVEAPKEPKPEKIFARALRGLIALFLVGTLLLWLVPDKIASVAATLRARPLASLLSGLLTLAGFPVAMLVVALVTALLAVLFGMLTLGKPMALTLVLGLLAEVALGVKLWIALAFFAPIVVALVVGGGLPRGPRSARPRFLALALGLVVLTVVLLIPFVGPLAGALIALFGLGAGSLWSIGYWSRRRAASG